MAGRRARWAAVAVALVLGPGWSAPAYADEVTDGQWYVSALRLKQAHAVTRGAGVTVAVVDTGVDASHPDLSGSVLPGADFSTSFTTSSGDGRKDTDGHGTGMASLIAGHGRITGVAPQAKIVPVRDDGAGSHMAAAVQWAVDHGVDVISISRVETTEDARLRQAVAKAVAAGIVVVAGAGNQPKSTTVGYPARFPGVVAVCATTRSGGHAAISVIGPELVLCAPGENVSGADRDDGYAIGDGTSNATALVAGAAALIRAKYPAMSATEVIQRLTSTADDKGTPGRDEEFGFGIVNPLAALTSTPSVASTGPANKTSAGAGGERQPRGGVSAPVLFALIGLGLLVLATAAGVGVWALVRRR